MKKKTEKIKIFTDDYYIPNIKLKIIIIILKWKMCRNPVVSCFTFIVGVNIKCDIFQSFGAHQMLGNTLNAGRLQQILCILF